MLDTGSTVETPNRSAPASQAGRVGTDRLGAVSMTIDAMFKGYALEEGVMGRIAGHDLAQFRIGTRRYAAVVHPDYVDHVLYDKDGRYHKSAIYDVFRVATDISVLTDEGASWRRHRGMINPMFGRRRLNGLIDLMVDPIKTHAAGMLPPDGRTQVRDVHDDMVGLTLDVLGAAMFSQPLTPLFEDANEMITFFTRMVANLDRGLLVYSPPPSAFRAVGRVMRSHTAKVPPPLRRFHQLNLFFDDMAYGMIRDRQENPTDSVDFLNHLLSCSDDEGPMAIDRVRNELLTTISAGHETTANALTWLWYLLAENPEARDRMYAEVDEVLDGRQPTLEDLAQLPWTQACFEEAIRCYPPIWQVSREAVRDDVIDGHQIRRGTTVFIPIYLIQHDERWWPEPYRYDPSRFLPGADKDRPRSAYVPFIGGPRICIGRSFALMEAVLIAAMLAQRFVFDLEPGFALDVEASLTLRPRDGLPMVVRSRTDVSQPA